MLTVRVIDPVGNREDVEMEAVPRIGERVVRTFKVGHGPNSRDEIYRVKDVKYHLDHPTGQAAILLEEEINPVEWPS